MDSELNKVGVNLNQRIKRINIHTPILPGYDCGHGGFQTYFKGYKKLLFCYAKIFWNGKSVPLGECADSYSLKKIPGISGIRQHVYSRGQISWYSECTAL